MLRQALSIVPLLALLAGCSPDPSVVVPESVAGLDAADGPSASQRLIREDIPTENPGPPFYARVTPILDQFFHDDGWLAVPFYRPPSCVPEDFNLLELFDFPSPAGPGAFGCPLLFEGFLLTEPDAPPGRFPRHVVLEGDGSPFWFVPWEAFQDAAGDGVVTTSELEALGPLVGTTRRYHEILKPREGDHLVEIRATGTLADGRSFSFHVTHRENRTRAIQIQFR